MNRLVPRVSLSLLPLCALSTLALGQQALDFLPGRVLSEEASVVPDGANPGTHAAKGKLARLVKTPMGAHDGRLISVYIDANNPGANVWEPKGGEHPPRDVFARYSDDDGVSWSSPVNLSNTTGIFSAMTDWNGDGVNEPYYGDSGKASIFNSGNNVVVTWVDKYCPEATWSFGDVGQSVIQGVVEYPDLDVYPETRDVPYASMWAAVSSDGGTTWSYGDLALNPALQLTYGRRDAIQHAVKGSGARWVVTWQEDPEGLQRGEAEGPGDGASGANVTQGTDIWYAWTGDLVNDPLALLTNRTPLSDGSEYDMMGTNGFPHYLTGDGKAGTHENHGCSRANLALVNDGGVFRALVSYEETKGVNDVLLGKTIQYHAFPFDQPVINGSDVRRFGGAGTMLTDLLENSRRVRFVTQGPNGVDPAIAIFWKQGTGDQGAPSDIMLKVVTSFDESSVLAAPLLNFSTNTPSATDVDFALTTSANPIEDARAHRAVLRGSLLVVGYSYTPNSPLARYTDLENYDFWIRRSLDGGASWTSPERMTSLDKSITVLEPRLVAPSKTGTEDPNAFLVGWGTETNVYEGIEDSVSLDVHMTVTTDQGATFAPILPVGATLAGESESQFRTNDDLSRIYAVWMEDRGGDKNAMFARAEDRNPLHLDLVGVPADPGGVIDLTLQAPGHEFQVYRIGVSMGFTPGIDTSFGNIPLNLDDILLGSLVDTTSFVNFAGLVGMDGTATAMAHVPNRLELSGLRFYTAFVLFPMFPTQTFAISAVEEVEIR